MLTVLALACVGDDGRDARPPGPSTAPTTEAAPTVATTVEVAAVPASGEPTSSRVSAPSTGAPDTTVTAVSTSPAVTTVEGGEPVQAEFSIVDEVADRVGDSTGGGALAGGYEDVTDRTGTIRIEAPAAWTSRRGAPVRLDDGTRIPYLAVAPDVEAFLGSYDVPGLIVRAEPLGPDVAALLEELSFAADCTDGGVTDFADPVLSGQYQVWQDCAGTSNDVVTVAANPAGGSSTAVIVAGIVTDDDVRALDRALATLDIGEP